MNATELEKSLTWSDLISPAFSQLLPFKVNICPRLSAANTNWSFTTWRVGHWFDTGRPGPSLHLLSSRLRISTVWDVSSEYNFKIIYCGIPNMVRSFVNNLFWSFFQTFKNKLILFALKIFSIYFLESLLKTIFHTLKKFLKNCLFWKNDVFSNLLFFFFRFYFSERSKLFLKCSFIYLNNTIVHKNFVLFQRFCCLQS